jgi:hypothetical protein
VLEAVVVLAVGDIMLDSDVIAHPNRLGAQPSLEHGQTLALVWVCALTTITRFSGDDAVPQLMPQVVPMGGWKEDVTNMCPVKPHEETTL